MKKQQIEALWGHVHWLGVLAEAGSYTGAAARLGVSKAAVSQRIRELELAAGVPLVRRTTRSQTAGVGDPAPPSYLAKLYAIATPTMKRKNGKIRSVGVQPCQLAWPSGQ